MVKNELWEVKQSKVKIRVAESVKKDTTLAKLNTMSFNGGGGPRIFK